MLKFTPVFVILLLLFFHYSSLGPVAASREGAKLSYPFRQMKVRKLETEIMGRDYDGPGPNPKHEPRKGKPGGGRQ